MNAIDVNNIELSRERNVVGEETTVGDGIQTVDAETTAKQLQTHSAR